MYDKRRAGGPARKRRCGPILIAVGRKRGNIVDGQVASFERQIAAGLLILGGLVFAVGGILYTGRAILKWPAAETQGYLVWERGFIIAAVLVNVLGLALLEHILRVAGDPLIARLGLVTYLLAAVIVVVAETSYLSKQEWVYAQVVVYVVLALVAQAAFGVALLGTGIVPGWVGWATVVWNLGWLVVLPIATPGNIYFPALHHAAPLLIGIALLVRG